MADLFSGTKSVSNVFKARGWEVETVDLLDGQDVKTWEPGDNYAFIWASPPCETFSVASIGTHWKMNGWAVPKTDRARDALELVKTTFQKILLANPKFYLVENPRGMLRKAWGSPADTTWWCQWGDERAKPTDLWGEAPPGLLPLPKCRNGATDHAEARRGAKTGTQGRKGLDRARIPERFTNHLIDVLEACL
jgi:hypothetical protein